MKRLENIIFGQELLILLVIALILGAMCFAARYDAMQAMQVIR